MVKYRTRKQGRLLGGQQFALLGLAAFLVVNGYLLMRHKGPTLDSDVPHGEGERR